MPAFSSMVLTLLKREYQSGSVYRAYTIEEDGSANHRSSSTYLSEWRHEATQFSNDVLIPPATSRCSRTFDNWCQWGYLSHSRCGCQHSPSLTFPAEWQSFGPAQDGQSTSRRKGEEHRASDRV